MRKPKVGDVWKVVRPGEFYVAPDKNIMKYGMVFEVLEINHDLGDDKAGSKVTYPNGQSWWSCCSLKNTATFISAKGESPEEVEPGFFVGDDVLIHDRIEATVISRESANRMWDIYFKENSPVSDWNNTIPVMADHIGEWTCHWPLGINGFIAGVVTNVSARSGEDLPGGYVQLLLDIHEDKLARRQ